MLSAPRRVGVVGLGTMAHYYLAAVQRSPHWELAGVCDVHAAVLGPHLSRATGYLDHRDMFHAADLDAVIVTAPNDTHARVCRDALHAELPVCVEKPLAITVAEGRELAGLAERTTLFTAFHRRYNDNVLRLLAGAEGRIESMTVRYLERIEEHLGGDTWYLDPVRCGGGCVADNGPNAFDLVRLFLGEVSVRDAAVTRDEHGVDRQAVVRLRSATGVPAIVELDWSHPGETKDVELRFADGSVRRADMLAGHDGFKASLWHEYDGILADFGAAIDNGRCAGGSSGGGDGLSRDGLSRDGGLAALELVGDTYRVHDRSAGEHGRECIR